MSNCFLSYLYCIVEEFKSWVIDIVYERVQSVGRHFRVAVLCVDVYGHARSSARLAYVDGRIVTLTSVKIRDHLEALRVQQMSSRTCQRHRARHVLSRTRRFYLVSL